MVLGTVYEDGHTGPSEPPDESVDTGFVVEVSVAAHDDFDVGRIDVQPSHVFNDTVGAGAGVKE
jgi:hypothetical protein